MGDAADLPEVPDQVFITDPSQFEALSSPIRMRVLKAAQAPRSVREIAEALNVPITRLYYHVNLLEAAGFLAVVQTRKSGARLEKLYRVTGKTITPGPELAENVDDPAEAATAMAAIVIEPMRIEAEAGIARRLDGSDVRMEMSRSMGMLTPAQAEDLLEQLRNLVTATIGDSEASTDPEAIPYALTYVLSPVDPG